MKNSHLTPADIRRMFGHWINTREYGYLGSDYGFKATVLRLSARAQDQAATDALLDKLRRDIAVFNDVDVQLRWLAGGSDIELMLNGDWTAFALDRTT